jgi:RNA polymerase sigma factor (sigma-70 family)
MSNNIPDKKTEIEIHITALNITSDVFGRLYDVYVKPIFRFIYFKVSSREEAEDLTSETFLKAWDYISRPGNENKIRNLKAFFYQIAGNLVVDFYRKRAFLPLPLNYISETTDIPDGQVSNIDKIGKDDEIKDLKEALRIIPENYCDIIIWYYLEDLKISEIAQIIQKSEGAVRVLIHRALKALKKELEQIEKQRKNSVKNLSEKVGLKPEPMLKEADELPEALKKISNKEISEQILK